MASCLIFVVVIQQLALQMRVKQVELDALLFARGKFIAQVEQHLVRRAALGEVRLGALKWAWEERRLPPFRAAAEGDETGQARVLRTESVERPRAEARPRERD